MTKDSCTYLFERRGGGFQRPIHILTKGPCGRCGQSLLRCGIFLDIVIRKFPEPATRRTPWLGFAVRAVSAIFCPSPRMTKDWYTYLWKRREGGLSGIHSRLDERLRQVWPISTHIWNLPGYCNPKVSRACHPPHPLAGFCSPSGFSHILS